MDEGQQTWITLAKLIRPQGRRGELLADLFTDFPDLFTSCSSLVLCKGGEDRKPVAVTAHWLPTGRSAGRIVLKFAGTDSISQAETLMGLEVQMPAEERAPLQEETYYVTDLVGCSLWNGDRLLGTVSDVRFPVNADGRRLHDAAALFVVLRAQEDELLVPFANAFVRLIDVPGRRIEMALPAGLNGESEAQEST